MKRGQPLKRSAIERSEKPMKRTAIKRGPLSSPTKRTTATVDAIIRRKVQERSRGVCEFGTPVCTGTAVHVHHKAGRGKGMSTMALLLHGCRECHQYAHAHPAESYERGWMIRRVT